MSTDGYQPTNDLPEEPPNAPDFSATSAGDPSCCAELHRKVDRILDLLEDRKAKREPADGVYRVTHSPAGEAVAYWQQKQVEAQSAAGDTDVISLMPAIVERLAQATREIRIPDLEHVATFQRPNQEKH